MLYPIIAGRWQSLVAPGEALLTNDLCQLGVTCRNVQAPFISTLPDADANIERKLTDLKAELQAELVAAVLAGEWHMNRSGQYLNLGGRSPAGSEESERAAAKRSRRRQITIKHGQRGAGRVKALFFLAVFAGMIYVGVKVIPILVNDYEFQDAIESTARFASVNRQNAEEIRTAVLKEAQNEEIPIVADDIHVKDDGGHVEISADYSVTVDLRVYQWTLNFHPGAKNNPI